jgi:hypothetical protein
MVAGKTRTLMTLAPFPRTNSKDEFFELVNPATQA